MNNSPEISILPLVSRKMKLGDGRELQLTQLLTNQMLEAERLADKEAEFTQQHGYHTNLRMHLLQQAILIDGRKPEIKELLELKSMDHEAIWYLFEQDNKPTIDL